MMRTTALNDSNIQPDNNRCDKTGDYSRLTVLTVSDSTFSYLHSFENLEKRLIASFERDKQDCTHSQVGVSGERPIKWKPNPRI